MTYVNVNIPISGQTHENLARFKMDAELKFWQGQADILQRRKD